jgi:hypothetical protein
MSVTETVPVNVLPARDPAVVLYFVALERQLDAGSCTGGA